MQPFCLTCMTDNPATEDISSRVMVLPANSRTNAYTMYIMEVLYIKDLIKLCWIFLQLPWKRKNIWNWRKDQISLAEHDEWIKRLVDWIECRRICCYYKAYGKKISSLLERVKSKSAKQKWTYFKRLQL